MDEDFIMEEYLIVIYEWLRLFFHAGLYPHFGVSFTWFAVAVIWSMSGFVAATIAESKGHNVMLHFAGGLLLPYAYPITIIFTLKERFGKNVMESALDRSELRVDIASYEITEKIKQNRIKKQLDKLGVDADSDEGQKILIREEKVFEKHDIAIAIPETKEVIEEAVPVDADSDEIAPTILNKTYFDSIAVNQLGERTGPFNVELTNGNKMVAEMIVNTLDELAVFEIVDHNGRSKRIRIKYANIASCLLRAKD